MVERRNEFFSISQVAPQVGERPWRLAYLIGRGAIPGPSVQLPGRRVFSAEDVERIRAALAALSKPAQPESVATALEGGIEP
jgi:hypothetical protein